MFTDLCGGLNEWIKINNKNIKKEKKNSHSLLTHKTIMKIALSEKNCTKDGLKF